MNKFMKKIVTGVLALTMVLGTVLSVSATSIAPPDPLNEDGEALIQKEFKVPDGFSVPDETFLFTFTPLGITSDADGGIIDDNTNPAFVDPDAMPDFGTDVTINSITDLDPDAPPSVGGFQIFKGDIDALDAAGITANDFPHAGVYVYLVEETATDTDIMKYSKAKYFMYIYVKNDSIPDGTLKIEEVGFRESVPESNIIIPGVTARPTLAPEDPTLDPDDPLYAGTDTTAPKAPPIFTNLYIPPADLEASKAVSGPFADTTKKFTYTLTVERPLLAAQLDTVGVTYTGTIYNADGSPATWNDDGDDGTTAEVPIRVTVTFEAGEQDGVVASAGVTGTFQLSHGQYVDFLQPPAAGQTVGVPQAGIRTGLPAGSIWTLEEAAADRYTPVVMVYNNTTTGVEQKNSPSVPNQPLKIFETGDSPDEIALTLGESKNASAWTNTHLEVSPTGILLNNLPFILLILVSIGGFVGYIVSKRRKAMN